MEMVESFSALIFTGEVSTFFQLLVSTGSPVEEA
jgi:hypothetical protein